MNKQPAFARYKHKRDAHDHELHDAAETGDFLIVRKLIVEGSVKNINMRGEGNATALFLAAGAGHRQIVEELLKNGADMTLVATENDWSPMHVAAVGGHNSVLSYLLHKGADLHVRDVNGLTPLHMAACGLQRETTQLLLKKGADAEATDLFGKTPLDLVLDVEYLPESEREEWRQLFGQ